MKFKVVILFSVLMISQIGSSQSVNFQMDQKMWQEDFQFLKRKVEKTVPAYQNPNNKKAFDKIYDIIKTSELRNDKIEIVYAIQRLLNTLNDEGCNVPLFQEGIALEVLPMKTYWFNDGLFVLDATESYKDIIGQQIVKINGLPIEEVFTKLEPILNADNKHYKKNLFQVYGLMPAVLKIIGQGKTDHHVELQFATGSDKIVKSSPINEYATLSRGLPNDEASSFSNKDYKGDNYWLEILPNSKTLFVQMQLIANNKEGASFSDFTGQIESLMTTHKIDKLVLDLRYGGGGNGFKLKRFTDLLRASPVINKRGNLFVLTSKATRGTLLELASILKLNTKAVIIGEPTAEGPNTVGDIKYITLPNSKIKVSITHTFWPTSWQNDMSTFISPDIAVAYNYSDYTKNLDPWLDLISSYNVTENHQPIPSNLMNQLPGSYNIQGRKVTIKAIDGRLFLTMNRKMKSFFEIHTELHFKTEGTLSTDIENVTMTYSSTSSKEIKLETLEWNELSLSIK